MCLDYYNYKRRSLSENEKSPIEDSRHLGLTAGNRPAGDKGGKVRPGDGGKNGAPPGNPNCPDGE